MALLKEAQQAAEDLLRRDPDLASCPLTAQRVRELFDVNRDALN